MITLFLLYCGVSGYTGIADAKYNLFLWLSGGYVILSTILYIETAIVGEKVLSPKEFLRNSSWTQRCLLIYMVFTWLSALLSPHGFVAWTGSSRHEGALTLTIYVLCFLFLSVFGRVERWMLPVCALSVSVFSVISILQLGGLNPFTLYPKGYNYFGAYQDYGGAYLGTIGNVDLVASFLCIAIPIFAVALLRRVTQEWSVLCAIALVAACIVLVRMNVIAGYVGTLSGLVLSLPLILPVSGRTRKIMCGVLIGCALANAVLLFAVDVGDGFLHELHELLHGRIEDSFGSGRIYIWKRVLSRARNALFLGYGPDTMLLENIGSFSRFHEELGIMIEAQIDTAHNEYLNILFHQGLFAFAAYLAALVSAIKRWITSGSKDAAVAILGSAALCYCIQACFGISSCITAIYFWLTLGLLESHLQRMNQGGKTK